MKALSRSVGKQKPAVPVIPALSERTRWAYYMHAMDPDDSDREMMEKMTKAFGPVHPNWLISGLAARRTSKESFRATREHLLCLSREELAAYLDLSVKTIAAWENGKTPIPIAVCEVMRLLLDSLLFRLSGKEWDGWFIDRKTGHLRSPDVGRLTVKPQEINTLPSLYSMIEAYKSKAERLQKLLDEQIAENTRIRELVRPRFPGHLIWCF